MIGCTAAENSGHCLNQDCGIITATLKGEFRWEPNENEEDSPPSLKPYCYPQVFCVVYVEGGSKRYTPLQVRQKVRKCWKYLSIVATLAIRR